MTEDRRRDLLFFGVAFAVICLVFTIFYTKHLVRQSEMRDCGNLRSDIETYQAIPPLTEAGRGQWSSKLSRYREIGCRPALPDMPPMKTQRNR